MSPNQPTAAADGLPSGLEVLEQEKGNGASNALPAETPQSQTPVRDIIRLYQCRQCSVPLQDAVTLPCGRSVCRKCLPEPHYRTNITYPAVADRLQGFRCPFRECGKEHSMGDCNIDVLLNKAVEFMRQEMERKQIEAVKEGISTLIRIQDPWHAAGISSLGDDVNIAKEMSGGKLLSTWALAQDGSLKLDAEVSHEISSERESLAKSLEDDLMIRAKQATRLEMDCQVCYALFCDPLTTGCGHTFCRTCLHRILDHSSYCPVCRCKITLNALLEQSSSPSNEGITRIIETYWIEEVIARKEAVAAEARGRHQNFDIPIFVCTLSFPMMPTFLHIFEPRYRLMVRRALEGDRTFGMVLPKHPRHSGDSHFEEMGTLLKIVNVQFYPDGRSLLETTGLWRFRVTEHGSVDGYTMGKIERIDDMSLEEEEAVEAAEVGSSTTQPDGGTTESQGDGNAQTEHPQEHTETRVEDLDKMSTQSLMRFATTFVERMRAQSVPWMTQRMLAIYGESPNDPAVFPWWFASMLPVRDLEKYRLLGTSSVRDRLKICCAWIVEWETSRWTHLTDDRSGLFMAVSSSDD